MTCDHDDLGVFTLAFYLFQDIDPVHFRKPYIQEDQVEIFGFEELQAFFSGVRGLYGETLVLQDSF